MEYCGFMSGWVCISAYDTQINTTTLSLLYTLLDKPEGFLYTCLFLIKIKMNFVWLKGLSIANTNLMCAEKYVEK